MKTTLVTGAAGFLGQALVQSLKSENHHVSVIGHGTTDLFNHDGQIQVLGEEIELKNLQRLNRAIDTVYHFAGTSSVQVAENDPAADRIKSLVSTEILLQFLEKSSPNSCLVYSSSAAVYGHSSDQLPLKEDQDLRPISVYGQTKLACERAIQQSPLSSVIVRFFSIYGVGLRKQLFWDASNKLVRQDFHFFGAANAYRDWIHVQDAVQLLAVLVKAQTRGNKTIYNGANGQPIEVGVALKLLGQSLGVAGEPIFDRGQKVGDPQGQCGDISKISALGYRPSMSLTQGLAEYGQWFLRNKAASS